MQQNEQTDPSQSDKQVVEALHEDSSAVRIRRDLALIMTGLLVVMALVAAFQIGAMPVLDKMLPLIAIVFGFFFGHKASKL